MSVKRFFQISSPMVLAVLVASCGGGSSDSSGDSVPESAGANGVTDSSGANGGTNFPATDNQVSGRVADGYIRGAIVCVDQNGNDACDDDEPSAVTGDGGTYDLTIPPGDEDKSIVASIPATAIDEDTGEAIGEPLVFIAPGDKPDFISPITTLVHQELQSNPTLDTDEAEEAVKELLGVEDEDISLFTDYVASGSESETETEESNNYSYLHDTARVVTSMMKDIENQVEVAAQSNGVDVAGDEDTQRAIRDIVRSEVRELLPEIARQVAEIVSVDGSEETGTDSGAGSGGGEVEAFDPEAIAISLRPVDVTDNVQDRIEAVVDRVEPVRSDIETVLNDGVYWLEFDCYQDDHFDESSIDIATTEQEILADEDNSDNANRVVEEEASGAAQNENNCTPVYGKVELDSTGEQLVSQSFGLDPASGGWVEQVADADEAHDFILVDGQWQEVSGVEGPHGSVEFTTEGSAVVTNSESTMEIKAVTQDVATVAVRKYLLSDDADPVWFELLDDSDLFSSGAQAHMISVKEAFNPYVLFNAKPHDLDEGQACAQYSDNCNVVGQWFDGQFAAVSTLDEIRLEASVKGIELSTLFPYGGPFGDLSFVLASDFTDELPLSGTVEWSGFGYEGSPDGSTYPADQFDECYIPVDLPIGVNPDEESNGYPEPVCIVPDPDSQPDVADNINSADENQDGFEQEQCYLPDESATGSTVVPADGQDEEFLPHTDSTLCVDVSVQSGEGNQSTGPDVSPQANQPLITSRWSMIAVDGVTMIEITLPDTLRYDDGDSEQAILLVEYDGVVRQGARLQQTYIDRVITFNEIAFLKMQEIAERSGAK